MGISSSTMAVKNIAVVVPTIRPEMIDKFYKEWELLFDKHNVEIIIISDGQKPRLFLNGEFIKFNYPKDLIQHHYAGIVNIGFAFIAKYLPEIEYIIVLNDDESPIGDPIQDHIDALNQRVSISLVSVASEWMRGMPYNAREESPVMLSMGVWEGVPDWDAPSQLLKGDIKPTFPKQVIPKGIQFPFCGMNYAFRRESLPYIYHAPVAEFKGAERFDDIWAGLEIVKEFAKLNWGIVSGYSRVYHQRASNVWKNLSKEYIGLEKNEQYWKGEYDEWYKDYLKKREKWKKYIKAL